MDGEVGAGSGGEPLAERAPPAAAPGLQAEASDAEHAVEYEVLDGVIDLGYRQLPSLAGVRVSAGVEELELTGNRLDESAIACVLEDADAGARLASLEDSIERLAKAQRATGQPMARPPTLLQQRSSPTAMSTARALGQGGAPLSYGMPGGGGRSSLRERERQFSTLQLSA